MKKIILLTLCVLSQMVSLQAFDIEARVAYFLPQDNRIRKLYGKHGLPEYQIEVAAPLNLCCACSNDWDVWANFAYYHEHGHTNCLHFKTEVDNLAINFGVRRFIDTCSCFRPYFGLGVGPAYVHFHDRAPFVRNNVNRWGVALLAKSGVRYNINCNFFADVFVDYGYNWFRFSNHGCGSRRNVNTGGLKVGLGLGYSF